MTFSSRVAEAMERNEETRASAVPDASPEGSNIMLEPYTKEEATHLSLGDRCPPDHRGRLYATIEALDVAQTRIALYEVERSGATPHDHKRQTLAMTAESLARTLNELKANPSPTSLEIAATLMHELKLVSLDIAESRRLSQAARGAR